MRNTRQRNAVQRVFREAKRPLSPGEVLEEASKWAGGIGIATVYRNINWLLDEGQIAPVEFPGEQTRYEKTGKEHHHHFYCKRCGRVFEAAGCAENLKALTPKGFKLESHEILLFGLCKDCASGKTEKDPPG